MYKLYFVHIIILMINVHEIQYKYQLIIQLLLLMKVKKTNRFVFC